jgi:hypothetical protein
MRNSNGTTAHAPHHASATMRYENLSAGAPAGNDRWPHRSVPSPLAWPRRPEPLAGDDAGPASEFRCCRWKHAGPRWARSQRGATVCGTSSVLKEARSERYEFSQGFACQPRAKSSRHSWSRHLESRRQRRRDSGRRLAKRHYAGPEALGPLRPHGVGGQVPLGAVPFSHYGRRSHSIACHDGAARRRASVRQHCMCIDATGSYRAPRLQSPRAQTTTTGGGAEHELVEENTGGGQSGRRDARVRRR